MQRVTHTSCAAAPDSCLQTIAQADIQSAIVNLLMLLGFEQRVGLKRVWNRVDAEAPPIC